ncbi:trwN protein [Bartonella sp. CB169]|uniref:trwN protein n=1 Tax=Bartonella sp. CB169 TaxID=3112257 RepID=UPI00300E5355
MAIPNFILLVFPRIQAGCLTTLPAVIMQELRGKVCATHVNWDHNLSLQFPILNKTIATTKLLKQNEHSFSAALGQISVKSLQWFSISLSDVLDPCVALKVIQSVLPHNCKKTILNHNSEQSPLSPYDMRNFKNGSSNIYMQKVTSYVGVHNSSALEEELQESVQRYKKKWKQIAEIGSLSVFSEELVNAYMHKVSNFMIPAQRRTLLH